MSHSTDRATEALFRFYLDRGFEADQINAPFRPGYERVGAYTFIHHRADGKPDFKVEFTDEEGPATVTLADGESGSVHVGEGENEVQDPDQYAGQD